MATIETTPDDTTMNRSTPGISVVPLVGVLESVPAPVFAGDTVTDPTVGATDTVTIKVGDNILLGADFGIGGTLSGTGLTQVDASTYTLTGTADQVTSDLDALSYVASRATGPVTNPAHSQITLSVESDLGEAPPFYASATIQVIDIPCYAAGTRIATARGEVAVEALRAGDVAIMATGGTAPIAWVGHRRVCNADPVRVVAGAFGPGLPARDLVLSPEHALFLDGHLIPVHVLVDGVSVVQEAWERVTYHHVELNRHGVLLAEGLPAESYLDTGNRTSFANGALVSLRADFGRGNMPAEACAPLALTGTVIEAQRTKLRAVAAEQDRAVA